MENIKIRSINVSLPRELVYQEKTIFSGIEKNSIFGDVFLSKLNLHGDGQGDLRFHGGLDKAICVYSFDHYPFWEKALGITLTPGAFGENLTLQDIKEEKVYIGDTFEIGETLVQVSQPRQPCFKLAAKLNQPHLPELVQNKGFTGFYFRVLKEGIVNSDLALKLVDRNPDSVSIAYANKIKYKEKDNLQGINKLLSIPELSNDWRETFTKRLASMIK